MIKICHIISGDLWAGAEVVSFQLLKELKNFNHIAIMTVLFNEGILEKKLREEGVKVYVLQEKGVFYNIILLIKLLKIIQKEKPDIIHSHKPKENIFSALTAKLIGIKNLISTMHGASEPFKGFQSLKSSFFNFCNCQILKSCFTHVVAVSKNLRNEMIKYSSASQLRVIANGIDPDMYKINLSKEDAKRKIGLSPELRTVGYFGRFTPIKGLRYLIDAARQISTSSNNVRFFIFGEGPLKVELEEQAKDLIDSRKIIFPGFIEDVKLYLKAMDIVTLSSLNEGIPMILLEAMANELPIVATRVGGIPEIVEDGKNGFLVPPQNPSALSQKLSLLLKDEKLMRTMGLAGKKILEDNFTASMMAKKYVQLYNQCLKNT